MIDLHTHTLLSDGELLASELVRRAEMKGYKAIAITDHCDRSNVDFIVPSIAKVSGELNKYWKIKVIPGVELTHVPLEEIGPLTDLARRLGARIVLMHGETLSEPVIKGTNRRAIEHGVDILAHPGDITKEDAKLAAEKNVFLEITARKSHSAANRHVAEAAREAGARLVLNTDAHSAEDLLTKETARRIIAGAGLTEPDMIEMFRNSEQIVNSLR